jgi:two-component system, chemotaxis family, chemotaxis protein CheY
MANKNLEKLKCLIVDDHALMRKLIKDFLAPLKITNLSYAENGRIAYEKLNASIKENGQRFNIVFLDLSMPEVDGHAMLKFCRNDRQYDNVAFVVVTGETSQEQIMKVVRAGATSFLSKPFTEKDFNSKLLNVINWLEEKKVI